MTLAGAEPLEARSGAPLDHVHYRDRQLRPLAEAIATTIGATAQDWLGDDDQLGLFAAPGEAR